MENCIESTIVSNTTSEVILKTIFKRLGIFAMFKKHEGYWALPSARRFAMLEKSMKKQEENADVDAIERKFDWNDAAKGYKEFLDLSGQLEHEASQA